jgi:hypothetical protein
VVQEKWLCCNELRSVLGTRAAAVMLSSVRGTRAVVL